MYTLLLVEDDENIMKINGNLLSKTGYRVLKAETLRAAQSVLETVEPDVIVLDILLPDGNGIQWCEKIRGGSQKPPVLFLSAKKDVTDILEGLAAGGDDYLTKPYQLSVLLERVKRLLEKTSLMPQAIYKGLLKIEVAPQRAFVGDMDLLLTQKEFSVLLFLSQREGQTVGAEYLYRQIWGQPMGNNNSAIKNTVSRLRKKLENSSYTILAKRGEGYCFQKCKNQV